MKNNKLFQFFLAVVLVSCSQNNGELFSIIPSEKTGVNFSNNLTETNDLSILDYLYFYNGGGVTIGDINNLIDIFLAVTKLKISCT